MLSEEKLAEVERVLDGKRILETDYCHECGDKLSTFTEDSTEEIIIRRYMGQFGHLFDIGFHKKCYDHYRHIDLILDGCTWQEGIGWVPVRGS